jgi:hypothetical protein
MVLGSTSHGAGSDLRGEPEGEDHGPGVGEVAESPVAAPAPPAWPTTRQRTTSRCWTPPWRTWSPARPRGASSSDLGPASQRRPTYTPGPVFPQLQTQGSLGCLASGEADPGAVTTLSDLPVGHDRGDSGDRMLADPGPGRRYDRELRREFTLLCTFVSPLIPISGVALQHAGQDRRQASRLFGIWIQVPSLLVLATHDVAVFRPVPPGLADPRAHHPRMHPTSPATFRTGQPTPTSPTTRACTSTSYGHATGHCGRTARRRPVRPALLARHRMGRIGGRTGVGGNPPQCLRSRTIPDLGAAPDIATAKIGARTPPRANG